MKNQIKKLSKAIKKALKNTVVKSVIILSIISISIISIAMGQENFVSKKENRGNGKQIITLFDGSFIHINEAYGTYEFTPWALGDYEYSFNSLEELTRFTENYKKLNFDTKDTEGKSEELIVNFEDRGKDKYMIVLFDGSLIHLDTTENIFEFTPWSCGDYKYSFKNIGELLKFTFNYIELNYE